jgi:uncharacterized membrane protein YeaQ/YmgE (transglycosylase-associated protein family)
MTFKRFIYEVIGYAILFFIARELCDLNIYIAIVIGYIGSLIGKFLYKYNGVFLEEIKGINILELENDKSRYEFEIYFNYKQKPYCFFGSFITSKNFETNQLRLFFYNNFNENKYVEVESKGKTMLRYKNMKEEFDITIYRESLVNH